MIDFDPCGTCGTCGRVDLHPPHREPGHGGAALVAALAIAMILACVVACLVKLVFP